ncbi:hypothetical protein [Streptomyces sp. NRRL F-5126]|uniref:hypothetical protein n=1 Tax=Streptomyces sp. NRRL F-5126 TaxID=1463857 RepID=UPI0004C5707D|nr:hypothetical protein [Streptomyces sp. NRRL F-5126]
MTEPLHVVLDDTAMVAVGQGNVLASRLIHRAHAEAGWHLYAPVCALVEADRARPGTAEHLSALPSVTIVELDLAGALGVAADEARGWALPHAQHIARPTAERPDGAVIATTRPARWTGHTVRVLDLTG